VLLEYGTHLVDMMRALLGEPHAVWARAHHPNARVRGESLAHAAFAYDGATAVVDVAWKSNGEPRAGLVLIGDEGEAHYDGTFTRGPRATLRLRRGDQIVVDEARVPTDDYAASFVAFQRAFAAAARGDGPLPQPASDNLRTLRATMAAYRSIDEGRAVTLPR
jgi:predicted dehydrogenase